MPLPPRRPFRNAALCEPLESRRLLSAAPTLLADLVAGSGGSSPQPFDSQAGGRLLFVATTPATGAELFSTDGTAAGTQLFLDINPGGGSSTPDAFGSVLLTPLTGNVMLFAADDGTHGRELWVTDGTAGNTHLLADINPGSQGSDPRFVSAHNHIAYFTADDGTHGKELWSSDGTAANTHLLADISPGAASSDPTILTNALDPANTAFVFKANDPAHGDELWTSDGTPAGTHLVLDVNPGSTSSNIQYCGTLNGKTFFGADDGVHGSELWSTDGTAGGTRLVSDLFPGPTSSSPHFLGNVGGVLLVGATDAGGAEVFKTDGTAGGTSVVANIGTGFPLGTVGSRLIFTGLRGGTQPELWASDGTAAGTAKLRDFTALGSLNSPVPIFGFGQSGITHVLFLVDTTDLNTFQVTHNIFASDGTPAGTTLLASPSAGFFPGFITPAMLGFDNAGAVFFTLPTTQYGKEVWRSDGTPAGTSLLMDVNPGAADSNPVGIGQLASALFFAADDGVHGAEPWSLAGSFPTTINNDGGGGGNNGGNGGGNNTGTSLLVEHGTGLTSAPDLRVAKLTLDPPPKGTTVRLTSSHLTGSLNVTNAGSGKTSGTIRVSYYLSSDTTPSTDDTLLASATVTAKSLAKKQSLPIKFDLRLPSGVIGTEHLIAFVNPAGAAAERTTLNNSAASSPFSLQRISVNLKAVSLTGPRGKPGATASVTFTIKNSSNTPFTGTVPVSLTYTPSQGAAPISLTLSPASLKFADLAINKATRSPILKFTIPNKLAKGHYSITATLDPGHTITQSLTSDDTSTALLRVQ